MPPGSYSQVFGGSNIYPSQPTYLLLNPLAASVILDWPIEQSMAGNFVVADIIDVNPTAPALTIQLSDARQVSTGYTALFNNIGANTFTVLDSTGATLATIASGTVWQIYLSDNTTAAGTWRIFQFGAGASSANAAALAGAGLIAITTTLNQNYAVNAQNANYNFVTADRAKAVEWTGGTGTGVLPAPATVTSGWFTVVKNSGTGIWTLSVTGGANIDGAATLSLNPQQSCFLISDGANFFSLGLGQQINSIFDFIQIDLTGRTGNVVLVGVQLNRISYRFIGPLAGNVQIIVPSTVQQYWVDNETTGAFTLTIQTAIPGITTQINQGSRNILYSDGTNVVPAVTFASTGFPNGTAAAPSITFAASPATGFYSPGLDQVAVSTHGTERLLVDAAGHFVFEQPDNTATAGYIFNGVTGALGTVARITTGSSAAAANPLLHLQSTAAGGFATLSISGNNGASGVNDLSIFQNGATLDATINQNAAASLIFRVNGTAAISIDNAAQTIMTVHPGGGTPLTINGVGTSANVCCQMNATVGGVALWLRGSAGGAPLIEFDGSALTGATTASFAATNKPGAGTLVSLWLPVSIAGTVYYIPLWN